MRVYLRQDVPKVGMAGEIVKVSDGYAQNFLFPKKLAVEITDDNISVYESRKRVIENRKEVIATETSMLAKKIEAITLVLKRKMHEGQRLYGAVAQVEIVDLLAQKGVKISKSQVLLEKSIKEKGTYPVTIKLSSRLQPACTLKVVPE